MKQLVIITISLFLVFQFIFTVKAKSDSTKENSNKPTVTEKSNKKPDKDSEDYVSPSEAAKEKTSAAKINKIKDATDDPEIEVEVGQMAQVQEQVEERAQEVLDNTEDRPSALKFLIGPDYKNLGQLRKEIVHTRNNIRQLEKIQERAGEEEQPLIDAAILEMEETASRLQTEMYNKLSGFSLFGWLFRWMNGFTPPEEEATPTVTVTPIPTGEVELTETPSPTEELSPTITEEVSPTESPEVSPSV